MRIILIVRLYWVPMDAKKASEEALNQVIDSAQM